jgi:hypothetical protein
LVTQNYYHSAGIRTHFAGLQSHSDEFLPQHISTSREISYENVDWRALVNHRERFTGAFRYFQFLGECMVQGAA